MPKPWKHALNHEDLFIQRYERLLGWARQLTVENLDQAEDLVHDAFVQFTFSRPDLERIENLDGYLYGMLRNLRRLQARRAARGPIRPLSIIEFDSVEMGLRSTSWTAQLSVQEQLRQVCRYVCSRKETSKAGSVLILRFFHGYYPGEIAQVMQTSRRAVAEWLRIARREGKLFLEQPDSLSFMGEQPPRLAVFTGAARTADELVGEMRSAIFRTRRGECLSHAQFDQLYGAQEPQPVVGEILSHIVSCRQCLDEVNRRLGLPRLSDRYPTDMLGPDTRGKDGGRGDHPQLTGSRQAMSKCRSRAKDVFEHRPEELCISVNDEIRVCQKISSALSEQSISLDEAETVNLIEVTSEQGVLLFFLAVESSPDGPAVQVAQVALSDGRTLEVTLDHRNLWPTLRVLYHDPQYSAEDALQPDSLPDISPRVTEDAAPAPIIPLKQGERAPFRARFLNVVLGVGHRVFDPRLWLRPGAVTAMISLILIAALLVWEFTSSVSAAELLRRSAAAEEVADARRDTVLRRTINMEERHAPGGTLITRRRIEVWQSAERGLTARRLYNEQGRLIAGEWRKANGECAIYRSQKSADDTSAIRNLEAWQLSPSAKEFRALIESAERAMVEEQPAAYVIHYENGAASGGLARASLTLSKTDLHAVEQTLVVRISDNDRQLKEFRLAETSYERRPASAVAPAVFEPDPELLGNDVWTRRHDDTATVSPSPHLPVPPPPPAATAELEVEALRQLNQANAFLGEQISVERKAEGQLHVKGIVETGERQSELLKALNAFKDNPAIKIEVLTVAEALSRQKQTPSAAVTLSRVEAARDEIPVEAELRRYFSKNGVPSNQLDAEIRRFCDRALGHAFQARRHALALKQIAESFSLDDLRGLQPQARSDWRGMLAGHARSFQQETASLRREIESAFPPLAAASDAGLELANDEELVRAIGRLFAYAGANDDGARRSFAIYAASQAAVPVKTPEFWRSLRDAESLAANIVGGRQ